MGLSTIISCSVLPWLLLLFLGNSNATSGETEELQTYIIHMDHYQKPAKFSTHESWHRSIIESLSHHHQTEEPLLYSYNHAMHGFSARLTQSQLSEIERSPAHRATYKESFAKLFTTHSSQFLRLNHKFGLWPTASYGEGVIIGIIDTGIWPESESFNDRGMQPAPQRWKGQCENGTAFGPANCNKKLIGARSFTKGLKVAGRKISPEVEHDSARDSLGHGTHVSSTAAGSPVQGASHFGYAKGTARGMAPAAHVAMYKIFSAKDSQETAATDVLAGMDQAISDGVDIMSLSLGFEQTPYFQDVIAVASLSAIEKGIFVVCAAGNDGTYESIHNGAPWITTVGAGTIDRTFTAAVTLGNGLTVHGESYFPESVYITDAPLYYGQGDPNKAICSSGAFTRSEVHRKIVLCDNANQTDVDEQKDELQRAGAYAGMFMTDLSLLDPGCYTIPSIVLSSASGALVRKYATGVTTAKVKSMEFMFTNLRTKPAPQVAYFSARGPDPINPSILKPDILAPGVDVLAAVVPNKPFMSVNGYNLSTNYALESGTSMAAPHVAGVAALLKSAHPEWSPAVIRSALMTTAYTTDNTHGTIKDEFTGYPITPLAFGAGHINPNKAKDPGLIYDVGFQDYVNVLCGLGYNHTQMSAILRRSHWNCIQVQGDLNYPSFIAIFTNKTSASPTRKTFSRVVTNVGNDTAVYHATVEIPPAYGMRITVEPTTLSFTHQYERQRFSVTVEIDKKTPPSELYGYLKWKDQYNHVVSSPVVALKTA